MGWRPADYLERGGVTVTAVGFIIEVLRLLKLAAWEVAAARREVEDMMGRLAGRGTEPGGGLPPSIGKGKGGLEPPIEEMAADMAALRRKYISRGEMGGAGAGWPGSKAGPAG